jgi:hypothetical protein
MPDRAQEEERVDPAEEVVFEELDKLSWSGSRAATAWTCSQHAVKALRSAGLLPSAGDGQGEVGAAGPGLSREEIDALLDTLPRVEFPPTVLPSAKRKLKALRSALEGDGAPEGREG